MTHRTTCIMCISVCIGVWIYSSQDCIIQKLSSCQPKESVISKPINRKRFEALLISSFFVSIVYNCSEELQKKGLVSEAYPFSQQLSSQPEPIDTTSFFFFFFFLQCIPLIAFLDSINRLKQTDSLIHSLSS